MMHPRRARLLEELPKHGYKVAPAAKAVGYSASYADKQPKEILRSALRAQSKELEQMASSASTPSKDMKRELASTLGITREELTNALKNIALNSKDYSSALKVLSVLAKNDLEINLNTEEAPKTIVPILNIGVKQVDIPNDPTDNMAS